MLTSDDFSSLLWIYIEEANGEKETLKEVLASEPRQVIIDFHNEFCRAIANLDEITLGNNASEDYRFDAFALIVSKGKEYYDEIVQHPERAKDVDGNGPFFVNVAGDVLMDKYGEEIYDVK